MQYVITISGNNPGLTEDESRRLEAEVGDKARAFVAELDGVTAAGASFGFISSQDLTSPDAPADHAIQDEAPAEEESGAETRGLKLGDKHP